jgi:phosphatidate cytidylyltransferase
MSSARQFAREWFVRAFFGLLLAAIAIAAIFAGSFIFAALLAIVGLAAAREWHRMVSGARYALETVITAGAIAAALGVYAARHHFLWPVAILAVGGVLAAGASRWRGAPAIWSGIGAIYLGVPALCLAALRLHSSHGAWVVAGLLITVWAADTGALIVGHLLGGPKLVPALSPNKTWSGLAGGIVLPAGALFIYVTYLGGVGWKAVILGAVLAAAGHLGDLFESWMKRRVGRKNSGSLIPGHGGVLDRIDSTLFVAPLAAALVFVFGLDLLFGAHP